VATSVFEFIINAKGNAKISCMNQKKITIAKGKTVSDDSVIAVAADCSAAELPAELKTALSEGKKLAVTIHTAGTEGTVTAYGNYDLKFSDKKNIIISKSDFVENATVGVEANKAAVDLSRALTGLLRDPGQEIKIKLSVLR